MWLRSSAARAEPRSHMPMAMTALGIETRFAQIRKAGPRVMALGLILYAWLLLGGYGIVKLAS